MLQLLQFRRRRASLGTELRLARSGFGFRFRRRHRSEPGQWQSPKRPPLHQAVKRGGIPWKNYQEDLTIAGGPTVSKSGTTSTHNTYFGTGQYNSAPKHNPMVFFTDTQFENLYDLTQLSNDLANNNVGRYNWISPDQFNDAHSALSGGFTYQSVHYTSDQAAIAQGDNFLSKIVPQIMASAGLSKQRRDCHLVG